MTKKIIKGREGFILDISPEVAEILGVNKQEDILIVIKGDEVSLKPKNYDPEHVKKRQEENARLNKELIKKFRPVLEKLSKT